jgi:hypothetical protein
MFSRLLSHKAGILAVMVTSALLASSLVGPAFGAPSPLSIAKKALKTAKKANKTAKKANKRSKTADGRSKDALSKATSAASSASGAKGTANAALSKAGQALSTAQFAAQHSGPGGIGFGNGPTVPNDGSSVSDEAVCPVELLPVGGGVAVLDSNLDPVTSGVVVTQSSINSDGTGWTGAVQDTDNSSDRILEVTVQCANPASVVFSGRDRRHRGYR